MILTLRKSPLGKFRRILETPGLGSTECGCNRSREDPVLEDILPTQEPTTEELDDIARWLHIRPTFIWRLARPFSTPTSKKETKHCDNKEPLINATPVSAPL